MFVAWGPELTFIYNDSYAEILGNKHPNAFGRPFEQVWSEIWGDISPLVEAALSGEATYRENLPLRVNRSNSEEEAWFTFSYSPVFDEAGYVRGMFCAVAETTNTVVAQRAVHESEMRFRNMADHSPVMMWVTEATGYCTYLNRRWYEYTGQRPKAGEGLGWLDAVHPEDRDLAKRAFVSANQEQQDYRVDFRLRRNDGVYRWVIDAAAARFADNGEFLGYVGSVLDIDDRREIEDKLREREQRLGLVQAAAGIGSFDNLVGGDGALCSPEYMSLYGLPAEHSTVTYQQWLELVHPLDRQRVEEETRAAVADPDCMRLNQEFRVQRADSGEVRWISSRTELQRDEDGLFTRSLGAQWDITERHVAQEALQQANDTLESRVAERTTELRVAHEALAQSQKMEALGQLTGGIAHDFNNLLTPIVGALDVVRRKTEDPRLIRLIGGAEASAERARTLIARLLSFSRKQRLESRDVSIDRLLVGTMDLLKQTLGPSIKVELEAATNLQARVDPNQLELALLNLAVNARDAMPNGGTLTIAAKREQVVAPHHAKLTPGEYICISVQDQGTGMSPETIKMAVEPFYSTKELGKGTGLGLSMVHGLAAQSGGGLHLESALGEGTRIDLWLPATAEGVELEEASSSDVEVDAVTPLRILLVDDEDLVRAATADMLTDVGHEVRQAHSGREALAILDSGEQYDLLLTDYAMPLMSGAALIREVERIAPSMPALLVTGYASAATDVPLAVPRIEKPFRAAELISRIQEVTS
jgi:PAS domain S-box-containing protein